MTVRILRGDCRAMLRSLEPESVHVCCTSPPYWGLRSYGVEPTLWGGDPECEHVFVDETIEKELRLGLGMEDLSERYRGGGKKVAKVDPLRFTRGLCVKCGCWRGDLGLEPTPELFIEHLCEVFDEVWRVLHPSGTLWVNIGDCYASGGGAGDQGRSGDRFERAHTQKYLGVNRGGRANAENAGKNRRRVGSNRAQRGDGNGGVPFAPLEQPNRSPIAGLKAKDLVGAPWMLAQALKAPRYTGRIKKLEDRIWLAAMLDAEGCMFISKRKVGQDSGSGYIRKSDTYSPGIEIANTSEAVIERIYSIVRRGSITSQGPEQNGRRKQTIFRWSLKANEAREFVRELYPHLVAKQQQARILYASPSSGDDASAAHQALIGLHRGQPVEVDADDPPSLFRPGWYLRMDIIWAKPNPMPESTDDRPTKSHEYVFMLSKSEQYFYDAEAIKEPVSGNAHSRKAKDGSGPQGVTPKSHEYGHGVKANTSFHAATSDLVSMRNKRSVWSIATTPFKEAHFATFPPALVEPMILAGSSARGCCPKCRSPWERITAPTDRYLRFLGRSYHDHEDDVGKGQMQQRGENRQNLLKSEDGIVSKEHETVGWYPTCRCDGLDDLPATPPPPRVEPPEGAGDDWEPDAAAKRDLERRRAEWREACRPVFARWREMCAAAESVATLPCVVLDPFGGSGTTGMVADRHGRHAALCELNPGYAEMAERRITGDAPLFARIAAE